MLADLSGMVFVWAFIGLTISFLYFVLLQTYFYSAVSLLLTSARYDLAVSFQWFCNDFYYVEKVSTQMNLLKQHKVYYLHVLFELQILNGGHSKGDLRVEKRL
jgi:hypothetical protein